MTSRQSKHNAKKRVELKAKGMTRFEAWIYPDDRERIQRYMDRINKQREREDG